MKSKKIKIKPVIFIYLIIGIFLVSYIAGILPFGLFLSLEVYSGLYLIVIKQRKTVKILADLIIINFLIVYENLSQLIKRKLMLISRSLLFLKILIVLDYKLPKLVHNVLLFISVNVPRKTRKAIKLTLKIIICSILDLLELINSSVTKLLSLINSFILRLRLVFNYLTAVYLSKKASLTRFVGIAVFVLIILFFFIGVKPGEESIKFVGAVGEGCAYETDCALCENCVGSICTYVGTGLADTLGTFQCTGTTGCSATSGDYCRCNGGGSCLTNNNGYCTLNAQCFNYCDAEDGVGGHETLYGLSTDNLVCFSGAACAGGLVKCGSHDGDCQYDPGSANECDDYSEGSAVGSTGYCDSNCGYHAKGTYKFYVKDSGGGNIASFDDAGNVVITGTLNEGEWLSGWDKRIKLTIDGTKVDEFLTWFPITVFLNSTQGEGIFDELDEDSDYMKVAFTDSDGLWQLYAEKELFDVSEQKAIYHISRDGWGIYSAEDMDIYMYYNNDHADNTDYVGAINTAAGAAVWDGNYKAVYHMVDATTSTVLDSTSNNNDGIKKGANEPVETIGQVGLGQDFDGSDDYINSSTNFEYSDITVEGFVNYDLDDARYDIISEHAGTGATSSGWGLFRDASDETMYWSCAENSNWHSLKGLTSLNAAGGWYYLAGVFDNTNNDQILYLNDGPDATNNSATHSIAYTVSTNANIGQNPTGNNNLNGQLDEIRISNIARSAAWIKATYNSLEDTLLTYENEETNIPSGNDDFIIQNSTGDWVAWIDGATGNMYLAGTMLDGQAISPPANSFIIQNSGGTAVSYIDSNGNLRLSGAFIEGGTP